MKDFINSPVFICGHPKSGTSLLTALLDGHPAVVAYPEETLFFRRFLPKAQGKSRKEKLKLAEKYLIHIFEWNQESPPDHQKNFPDRDYADISFEEVRDVMVSLLEEDRPDPTDFLNAAVMAYGKVTGTLTDQSKLWVEKTPYNALYAQTIFSEWTNAKCIHIVRDPRDNFVSYHRKQPSWTAKVFAYNWIRSTFAGIENKDKYGEDRYLILKFEDLLQEPNQVTHRLAAFLDIEWQETLLHPTRAGDRWRGNSMFAEKFQAIRTDPIGRWKEHLDPFDQAMIQIITKKVMSALGYPLADVRLSELRFRQLLKLFREQMLVWMRNP